MEQDPISKKILTIVKKINSRASVISPLIAIELDQGLHIQLVDIMAEEVSMKFNFQFSISAGLVILALAMNAQAKPSSEDFNSMIEENTATQKELRNQLEKQLKTERLDVDEKPDFNQVGEEVLGRASSENVVVANQNSETHHKNELKKNGMEKKNFKRLSQELKEIKE